MVVEIKYVHKWTLIDVEHVRYYPLSFTRHLLTTHYSLLFLLHPPSSSHHCLPPSLPPPPLSSIGSTTTNESCCLSLQWKAIIATIDEANTILPRPLPTVWCWHPFRDEVHLLHFFGRKLRFGGCLVRVFGLLSHKRL